MWYSTDGQRWQLLSGADGVIDQEPGAVVNDIVSTAAGVFAGGSYTDGNGWWQPCGTPLTASTGQPSAALSTHPPSAATTSLPPCWGSVPRARRCLAPRGRAACWPWAACVWGPTGSQPRGSRPMAFRGARPRRTSPRRGATKQPRGDRLSGRRFARALVRRGWQPTSSATVAMIRRPRLDRGPSCTPSHERPVLAHRPRGRRSPGRGTCGQLARSADLLVHSNGAWNQPSADGSLASPSRPQCRRASSRRRDTRDERRIVRPGTTARLRDKFGSGAHFEQWDVMADHCEGRSAIRRSTSSCRSQLAYWLWAPLPSRGRTKPGGQLDGSFCQFVPERGGHLAHRADKPGQSWGGRQRDRSRGGGCRPGDEADAGAGTSAIPGAGAGTSVTSAGAGAGVAQGSDVEPGTAPIIGRWLRRLPGSLGTATTSSGRQSQAVGWYSPDGTAWEAPQPLDTSPQLGTERPLATCWTGNGAVVVGSVTSTIRGSLPAAWVSSDGSSWTNASFSPSLATGSTTTVNGCLLLATGSSLTAGPRATARSNSRSCGARAMGRCGNSYRLRFRNWVAARRRGGRGTPRRHRHGDYDLVGLERGRRPPIPEMAGPGRRFGGRPVHGGWAVVFA